MAEKVFGEGWEDKGAAIYDEGPEKVNVWGIGQYVFHLSFTQWFKRVLVVVTSTPPGCGLTALHSKKSPDPGRLKSI